MKKLLLLAALIFALPLALALPAQAKLSQKCLDAGAALEAGQYENAKKLYSGCLKGRKLSKKERADMYAARATTWLKLNEPDKANKDINKALKKFKKDPDYTCIKGRVWLAKKNYGRAIKSFNTLVTTMEPDKPRGHVGLGKAYAGHRRYLQAMDEFDRAVQLGGGAEAYIARANQLYGLEHYEAAIRDADQALNLEPNNAEAYLIRGITWGRLEVVDFALRDLDKAIELDPSLHLAYATKANWLEVRGQHKAALKASLKATELGDNLSYYYVQSIIKMRLGDSEGAARDFAKTFEFDPIKSTKQLLITHISITPYNAKSKTLPALAKAVIKAYPKSAMGCFLQGVMSERSGDWERAKSHYTKAIGYDPEASYAYFARGVILAEKEKKYQDAYQDFWKMTSSDFYNPMAYVALGDMIKKATPPSYEHALERYERAVEFGPCDDLALERFAELSMRLGDDQQALNAYTKLLKLDPANPRAHHFRGLVYARLGHRKEAVADLVQATLLDMAYARKIGELQQDEQAMAHFDQAGILIKVLKYTGAECQEAVDDIANAGRALDKGDFAEALWQSGNYQEKVPYDYYRLVAHALLLAENGKDRAALDDLTLAVWLSPYKPEAHLWRGWLLAKKGHDEWAEAELGLAAFHSRSDKTAAEYHAAFKAGKKLPALEAKQVRSLLAYKWGKP